MSLKKQNLTCLRSFILRSGSLSKYFFPLWDSYYFSKYSELFSFDSKLDTGFIFRRQQYVTLSGDLNPTDLLDLKWKNEEVILSFIDNHLPLINSSFSDHHPTDETGDPNKSFNSFFVMRMHKDHWNTHRKYSTGDLSNVEVLMVSPDKEIKNLKRRPFDIPFLSSIPTVLLFKENFRQPAAIARIPNILREDEWAYGVIRDVWVRPSLRRRGYASIMMHRALKWLFDEQNLSQVFLYVESTNEPAVTLYEKLDWLKVDQVLSCYAKPARQLVTS
ncbi:MAG: GNAT family N-acetyltransferase [Candidatus Hodarchaeota archaeon]